jgi:DnaJ-class molecular chaperone
VTEREWIDKDFYAELGVSSTASADEIKKSYRKLARDLHPDKNPGDARSEAKFKSVGEAYSVLSNVESRKKYDETKALFGADWWPYGVAKNRESIDSFVSHCFRQDLTPGRVKLDDVFCPNTLHL